MANFMQLSVMERIAASNSEPNASELHELSEGMLV